ncbi:MAG: hypothetical protein ACP5US_01610 [Candidatus Kryptoniota bacterium]
MNYHNFDRYSLIMVIAALLIAILTYWRYWAIDPVSTFDYAAEGAVVQSLFSPQLAAQRPMVWDFFGVIDKMIDSRSIFLLKASSLIISVINLLMLFKIVSFLLGEKFWGFMGLFLFAISPPGVIAAVSGGPESASLAITLLFLYSLYRNQYLIGGMLSAIAIAINLPGVIYFIVVIFDILQNVQDKKKVLSLLISVPLIFFGFISVVYFYGKMSGTSPLTLIPFRLSDFKWRTTGELPIFLANGINIIGIVYLIIRRRYDVYVKHFHLLMLWLTFQSLAIALPSSINLLNALALSLILFLFFLQGLPVVWHFSSASTELFVIGFVILFLSFDLTGNNYFLQDGVLPEVRSRKEAVREVISSVKSVKGIRRIISNFVPGELAVNLGRTVYAVNGSLIPAGETYQEEGKSVYIVDRPIGSKVGDVPCKNILSTIYFSEGGGHSIKVFVCEGKNEQ